MKKLYFMVLFILVMLLATSCSKKAEDSSEGEKIDFTVVDDFNVPDELKEIINGKKADTFQMTFTSGESMYLVIGYGEQTTGGYSIKVDHLYTTEDGIHIQTNLLGPDKEREVSKKSSYPYIVVKIKTVDKDVIYE